MSPFDQIRSHIANPDDGAPAEVRRLLIQASRLTHPAAVERVSVEIDGFNEDFALLMVSSAVAGSPPLPDLQDRLRSRLTVIQRLVEVASASLN